MYMSNGSIPAGCNTSLASHCNAEMSPSTKTPEQHRLLPDWEVWCVTEQNLVQLSNLLSMNGPGMNAADKIYIQLIQFPLPLVYVTVGI